MISCHGTYTWPVAWPTARGMAYVHIPIAGCSSKLTDTLLYTCANVPTCCTGYEAHTHARTHTRTHASTQARTQAFKHSCMHAHTHARTHACAHARIHARTHAYMHARTHASAHARTHTHAQARGMSDQQIQCWPAATTGLPVACSATLGPVSPTPGPPASNG